MKYRVVVTGPAAMEVEDNARWWARERSAEQAANWYAGIRATMDSLDTSPGRCPLIAESDRFSYELRELYFGLGSRPTHRIVFTIVKQQVLVLTVRHVAQRSLRPGDIDFPS